MILLAGFLPAHDQRRHSRQEEESYEMARRAAMIAPTPARGPTSEPG